MSDQPDVLLEAALRRPRPPPRQGIRLAHLPAITAMGGIYLWLCFVLARFASERGESASLTWGSWWFAGLLTYRQPQTALHLGMAMALGVAVAVRASRAGWSSTVPIAAAMLALAIALPPLGLLVAFCDLFVCLHHEPPAAAPMRESVWPARSSAAPADGVAERMG